MKALPVLLAALLALTPVGAAALLSPAPVAPVGDAAPAGAGVGPRADTGGTRPDADVLDNRSIHVLTLRDGSLERSQIEIESADIGPAMTFDRDTSRQRLRTLAMVERIDSATTSDQRQRLILGALNDIEQQVVTLRTAQRDAISEYAAGSLSTRTFLVRLAAIDAQARALERRRSRLAELASETDNLGLSSRRLKGLERELDTFTGPVRHRVGNVVLGENESTRVYVATAPDAVVLSMIFDDAYLREAYRADLRDFGADGQMEPEEALNITSSNYPAVWLTKVNSTEVTGAGGIYRVDIPYRYGTLTTVTDAGTKQIFKESQTRSLSSFPPDDTVTRSRDGLRMTVNRSYPGGPIRISLVDVQTEQPVNANVTVGPQSGGNSDFVGYTGADGVLWAISPAEKYTVFAIQGNSVVAVDTQPVPPPRVYPTNNTSANTTPTNNSTGGGVQGGTTQRLVRQSSGD